MRKPLFYLIVLFVIVTFYNGVFAEVCSSLIVKKSTITNVLNPHTSSVYYCDPVNGSMSNNGFKSTPWASLEDVFKAGKVFAAGDTIYLMNGNHGHSEITAKNAGNVIITKCRDASPEIGRIEFNGAQYWTLKKIKITSNGKIVSNLNVPLEHPVFPLRENSLIYMQNVNNITIDSCTINSLDDNSVWTTADDWNFHAWTGIMMKSGGSNVAITNCHIKNVNFGTLFTASNSIYRNNVVENFCGDGIQFGCNNFKIENNIFRNTYDVNGNHHDIIQQYSGGADTHDVEIRGNTLLNFTDTNQPFRGGAHGMGLFDVMHTNYVIENNLVVVDTWNGITLLGATNCKIINNTVIDPNSTGVGPAWIQIGTSADNRLSSGNIVKNNLCTDLNNVANIGIVENNIEITIGQFDIYFVDYTNLDYHLKGGSAIEAGTSIGAPSVDLDGLSRPQGVKYDVGCYEFTGELSVTGVSMSISTLTMERGTSTNLIKSVLPEYASDKSVTWTTSDTLIVTVNSSGNIIAVGEGTATITVTTNDGDFTAECKVTVIQPSGNYNLALDKQVTTTSYDGTTIGNNIVDNDVSTRWSAETYPQSATIDLGEECIISKFEVHTYQDRNYLYIIEVSSDGTHFVKIVDRSSYTSTTQPISDTVNTTGRYIKVTVSGANGYSGAWISITELKVYGRPTGEYVAVSGISVDSKSLNLVIGQSFDLTETVAPIDATNKLVSWSSSEPSVATVSENGLVTAVSKGNTLITVTTNNGGFTATCALSVSFPTNVEDINKSIVQTEIWPNPLSLDKKLNIKISGFSYNQQINLKIMDLMGKVVFTDRFSTNNSGQIKLSIQLNSLRRGMYLLVIDNLDISLKKKLVIE